VNINPTIAGWAEDMTAWRRDLHAHPELGFEEQRTSAVVAEKLASWGIDVHRGLAGTGVVGTLAGREKSPHSIALRADMDALPLQETNDIPYASSTSGKMHACGHDGHVTMLLGAARYLAQTRDFAGTVHFVFQPAEEGLGGGARMVEDGLFARFPCDAVYGLHNWPGLPLGTVGVRSGPMMAAADSFTIEVIGRGGHAALPHFTVDPVLTAAHIISGLQSLVSRATDPLEAAVVSVTSVQGGHAHNVIPERVRLLGTARSFSSAVRDALEAGIKRIARATAEASGAQAVVDYRRIFPPLVNASAQVATAASAAATVVGEASVNRDYPPVMGSEDFAYMLEAKPGAYVFLGQAGGGHSSMIHSPHYDFNDALLPIGASYWLALVRQTLGSASGRG